MSGKMHGSIWQSDFEDNGAADDSSQHSETRGTIRTRVPDVAQRLHSLFKEQKYTDVKFVLSCGIKPKPVLMAHKAILAVGSKKFQDMLYGGPGLDVSRSQQTDIQINNIQLDAFRAIVEYLYTDDVCFESEESVMGILNAARLFEIQPLVDRCESYFESAEITENCACTKLQLATAHQMEKLKQTCVQFIQENTRSVIRSPDFTSSSMSTVRSICKLTKLNLRSEAELLEAVIAWAERQSATGQSKRVLVEPVFRHIRFLTIPCREFSQLVQKCPDIFTAEEALNIVMYLSNPTGKKSTSGLPSWCKISPNRCRNTGRPEGVAIRGRSPDQNFAIALRPSIRGHCRNLMCMLELKCQSTNQHLIKGLKLSFDDPVTDSSTIGSLIITINSSNYSFRELIKIHNSKEVVVPFTRTLLASIGNCISIRAEASDIRSYKFLQFDEDNSFSDSPFECSLGSIPKENRLFFISEVIYVVLPKQRLRRPMRNFRGGKAA